MAIGKHEQGRLGREFVRFTAWWLFGWLGNKALSTARGNPKSWVVSVPPLKLTKANQWLVRQKRISALTRLGWFSLLAVDHQHRHPALVLSVSVFPVILMCKRQASMIHDRSATTACCLLLAPAPWVTLPRGQDDRPDPPVPLAGGTSFSYGLRQCDPDAGCGFANARPCYLWEWNAGALPLLAGAPLDFAWQ
jgi:hypothetical protein